MKIETVGLKPALLIAGAVQVLGVIGQFVQAGVFTPASYIALGTAVLTTVGAFLAGPGQVTDSPGAAEPPHPEVGRRDR